jgi:hypothetical protein
MEKQEYIIRQEISHELINSENRQIIINEIRKRLVLENLERIEQIYNMNEVVFVNKFEMANETYSTFDAMYNSTQIFALKTTVFYKREHLKN